MTKEAKYNYTPLPEPIPITEQKWPKGTKPLVHTRTMTFMHEDYIRDCIEGILMQKTTFPVRVLIHDDASTDKTPEIVKEYEQKNPQSIKAYYQKENSHTKKDKAQRRAEFSSWHIGKYEAICEGDDYWTDPLKLQKQVDFMEQNPDFSMCFHSVELIKRHTPTGRISGAGEENIVFDQNKLFYSGGFHSPTASILYLKKYGEKKPEWRKVAPVGDVPLKLMLSLHGKIFYMKETMAVRRLSVPGSWNDRVRKNPIQEYYYHRGMIKMLEGFNKYTNGKFHHEVLDKILFYEKKTFFFRPKKERFDVLKDKHYKSALQRLPFLKKLEFFAVLYYPRIFDKNGIIRQRIKL